MTPTVWTSRRKWLGNLIPLIVWLPFAAVGLGWMLAHHTYLGPGLTLLIVATVLGWLSVNQFGLFENARMKTQLTRIVQARGDTADGDRWFVGFASPRYRGTLDAHEDVGFLILAPERLVFVSETRTVEIARTDIHRVVFRPNVHSLLGLGRWISVEGSIGARAIRLNVELREKPTLLANRREGKRLLARLQAWSRPKKSTN